MKYINDLIKGDTFKGFEVSLKRNGTAIDITGASILFQFKSISTNVLSDFEFKTENDTIIITNAVTATLVATGVYGIEIYPAVNPVVGTTTSGTIAQISSVLPRTWRVVYTIGGTTPSFTITNAQINYLL